MIYITYLKTYQFPQIPLISYSSWCLNLCWHDIWYSIKTKQLVDCISTRLWCAKEDKGKTGAGIKWDFSEWKATYLIQIKHFWSSHYCQNTEVTTEDKNLCKSPGNWDISLKKNWRIYLRIQNGNNLYVWPSGLQTGPTPTWFSIQEDFYILIFTQVKSL